MAYKARVDEVKCVSCGACIPRCPVAAITLDGKAFVDEIKCIGCSACVPACPVEAIVVKNRKEKEEKPEKKSQSQEQKEKKIEISSCSSCTGGIDCISSDQFKRAKPDFGIKDYKPEKKAECDLDSDMDDEWGDSCSCCGMDFFKGKNGIRNLALTIIGIFAFLIILNIFGDDENS